MNILLICLGLAACLVTARCQMFSNDMMTYMVLQNMLGGSGSSSSTAGSSSPLGALLGTPGRGAAATPGAGTAAALAALSTPTSNPLGAALAGRGTNAAGRGLFRGGMGGRRGLANILLLRQMGYDANDAFLCTRILPLHACIMSGML